jgi:hypothetical protein
MELLRAKLATSTSFAGNGDDEEARIRLRLVVEERLGDIEGDVKEVMDLGKKALRNPFEF